VHGPKQCPVPLCLLRPTTVSTLSTAATTRRGGPCQQPGAEGRTTRCDAGRRHRLLQQPAGEDHATPRRLTIRSPSASPGATPHLRWQKMACASAAYRPTPARPGPPRQGEDQHMGAGWVLDGYRPRAGRARPGRIMRRTRHGGVEAGQPSRGQSAGPGQAQADQADQAYWLSPGQGRPGQPGTGQPGTSQPGRPGPGGASPLKPAPAALPAATASEGCPTAGLYRPSLASRTQARV
jgi:hypothetical protein